MDPIMLVDADGNRCKVKLSKHEITQQPLLLMFWVDDLEWNMIWLTRYIVDDRVNWLDEDRDTHLRMRPTPIEFRQQIDCLVRNKAFW